MKPSFSSILLLVLFIDMYSLTPTKRNDSETNSRNVLSGIIHVHSVHSDGGGEVEEIALEGKRSKIDFIVLTDHNSSEARRRGYEKNYDGVDVFVEMESSIHAGHALSFYSHTPLKSVPDQSIVDLTHAYFSRPEPTQGSFFIIAHPSNVKKPWTRLDLLPHGIEVVNFDSIWQEGVYSSFFEYVGSALIYPFNQFLSILRFLKINRKDFIHWDTINISSPGRFGIIGHDAHSRVKVDPTLSIRWPSYSKMFKIASNLVFLNRPPKENFEERKLQIYHAIQEGRLGIIFQILYPFSGNDWSLKCQGTSHSVGDKVPFHSSCHFVIKTPKSLPFSTKVQLWKNGELLEERSGEEREMIFPVKDRGVYRVEIWADINSGLSLLINRDVPYLFYNPIYVQ